MSTIEPWERVRAVVRADFGIFRVREDISRSPVDGREHTFVVLEAPPWVNVIPITEDGRVVMIRQYRHGVGRTMLEIPAGLVDDGEMPLQTARRELLEETGFAADDFRRLGVVDPNPAIQDNQCFTFLAVNARRVAPQQLDEREVIEVVEIDRHHIPELIRTGEISSALVVAAFHLLDLHSDSS